MNRSVARFLASSAPESSYTSPEIEYYDVAIDITKARPTQLDSTDINSKYIILSKNEINIIIVEYSDRLAMFGFNYLKEFAKSFNVEIEAVEQKEKLELNEEMVNDLVSVITCFSAKIYGARGGRKLKQTLDELEKERQVDNIENNSKSNVD